MKGFEARSRAVLQTRTPTTSCAERNTDSNDLRLTFNASFLLSIMVEMIMLGFLTWKKKVHTTGERALSLWMKRAPSPQRSHAWDGCNGNDVSDYNTLRIRDRRKCLMTTLQAQPDCNVWTYMVPGSSCILRESASINVHAE